MNYCDKIHYSHLTASAADFPAMIDDLLSRMPKKGTVLRLVLFGSACFRRGICCLTADAQDKGTCVFRRLRTGV